jgi:hypothetical protein
MTVPSYTEDLTDIDLAANDTNWEECNATNWNTGGASTYDTDYPYIQGSGAVTQQATKAAIGGLMVDNGSGVTIPTDGAYFVWQVFTSNAGLDTYANGGLRVVVGSDRDNFKSWDVGGSDFGRYPYGGWVNHAVNPTETADDTVGSPTSTERYIGAAYKSLAAIGKGNPHGVDAIRYGRGSSIFEYGETDDYCTFAGYAAQNDNNSYMWGLIQAIAGGFLYKGKMTLGTASNAVDFRDSDALVLIDNTPKVTANFNTIEVNNSSSRVDMDNVIFKSLGTQSPGRWVTNDNCDQNITNCQFFDMGTFNFGGSTAEFLNCLWKNCGIINPAAGNMSGSSILTPNITQDTSPITWLANVDPDGKLDNLTIESHATVAHHAIEFGISSPTTMTINGLVATGFNASNGQNDSVFHVKRTFGTVTINCVGCTGTMSYKSAGATVVIAADPVTVQVTAKTATGTPVENARVMLKTKDATGPWPYQESISIVKAVVDAVVTHTGHPFKVNDWVLIEGANEEEYNGLHQIDAVNTDVYSYYVGSGASTPVTGTIVSSFVALYGLTNSSGIVSDTRVYSSDQPLTGWARKSTTSPYYKTAPVVETVDNADGLAATAILITDE